VQGQSISFQPGSAEGARVEGAPRAFDLRSHGGFPCPRSVGKTNWMRLLTTLVAAALLLPASASAQGGAAALIKDCQDEKIDGTYTAAEYRDALRRLPTDVDEYTGCRDTLRSAQLRAAAPTRSATPGGGAPTPIPAGARSAVQAAPSTPAGRAPPAAAPGAPEPVVAGAPVAVATSSSATARAPAIPGLPSSAAPPVSGDPAAAPLVPVSVATGAGDDVPPTLAVVLVVLAAALLVAAAVVRRQRRA